MLAQTLVVLVASAAVIAAPTDNTVPFLAKRGRPRPTAPTFPPGPSLPPTVPSGCPSCPPAQPPAPCPHQCGGSCIPAGAICCNDSGYWCPADCQCTKGTDHLVDLCLNLGIAQIDAGLL
ncbi:hypothetical protein CspeluHIS016_0403560 [Cutaneotrichosporon spelunceum]|uniref:Uncharacterized protein n=1 Tax=Cutaneotrichosporon spelunceum TaxID=1672016 RepID=A0AAD3TW64_9TREE|nr:hypothetical protein CspeluHIS016_0403560 [Cutaneotrichosporon spelunceum]